VELIMPRIVCPHCDEKVSYAEGKRSTKCPACGTKIELGQPDEGAGREEEEERPQKTAKKRVKKKAHASEPFGGRMTLIVCGPICLGLALWAPFSGYGTALSMVVGTLVMLAGCVVFGVKVYRDPDWSEEASGLLARLVPVVLVVICVRAAMASPRKFAGWGVLTVLGILTLSMGITANAVWKTMDEKPPQNGPGAPQPGQPAGPPPAPKETDDEIINKAITDLDSRKSSDVRGALDRLTKVKPNQRRAEVVRKLHTLIKSDDGSVRLPAVNALGSWGGSEDIPTLTPLLEDKDPGIRGAARKALGRLHAPIALPLLVEEIGGDHELYPIVAGYGEAAEDALLAGLGTRNVERKWYNDTGWYGAALTILGSVGTRKSIPTLERFAGLPEAGRAEPANRALTAIKSRTKQ
jgi:hypothetical protein